MPFPPNLEALEAAGYTFARQETCTECRELVQVFTTPGKREIVMDTMMLLTSPATRHYLSCAISQQSVEPSQEPGPSKPSPEPQKPQEGANTGQQIKLYGVTDKNMMAVGWLDGTLKVQFRFGCYLYANVAEDVFVKIRNNPFPNSLFTKIIKKHAELYPCTKVG